jgi:hypothetical protein
MCPTVNIQTFIKMIYYWNFGKFGVVFSSVYLLILRALTIYLGTHNLKIHKTKEWLFLLIRALYMVKFDFGGGINKGKGY